MIVFTSDHGDYLGDHWMGEKESLPRAVGEDPADHLRSVAGGRCDARHDLRRTGRGASISRRHFSKCSAAIRRSSRTGSKAGRWCRCSTATSRRLARVRGQRIRLFDPDTGASRSAWSRATRGCSCWRTSAGNTSTPSAFARCCSTCSPTRTSCAISAPIRPMPTCASASTRAARLGAALVAAHHPLRAADHRHARPGRTPRRADRRVGRERRAGRDVEGVFGRTVVPGTAKSAQQAFVATSYRPAASPNTATRAETRVRAARQIPHPRDRAGRAG